MHGGRPVRARPLPTYNTIGPEEREHLAVHDALAGGEPLHVALAEAPHDAAGVLIDAHREIAVAEERHRNAVARRERAEVERHLRNEETRLPEAIDYATVAGGLQNYATGSSSAIGGGFMPG